MTKDHPLMVRFFIYFVLPIAVFLMLFHNHLKGSLPKVKGTIQVSGITAPTTIQRDSMGVVNIKADTDFDAFFALGYSHAQDRLWQMELIKRTVQGRLSEVFGKQSLDTDIWLRTLGLYESAKSSWEPLSEEAKGSLIAYAAGVNALLAEKTVLPLEFKLLDIKPEKWTVYDSLAVVKLLALKLSGNFAKDIQRLLATQTLNEKQYLTVFDSYPSEAPVTAQKLSNGEKNDFVGLINKYADIETYLNLQGEYVGSNAWVVSSKHNKGAKTILANDPHLQLQIPTNWYAVSLKGERLDSSGMSLVGLPIIIFGRNQKLAWGGTNMMSDSQDLFLEQVNSRNSEYIKDGEWTPFLIREEKIFVKADFPANFRKKLKPVSIKVRSTEHGPIISDHYKVFNQPVSLSWTSLTPGDTTYEGFYRLNYADDWASFKLALSHHVSPNMNMFYADYNGNIGYLGVGHLPIRAKGDGSVPVPGWNGDYDWLGYVPPDEWPQIYNPEKGFIVNANNKVVDEDYPYFISRDWAPPHRAARISELLDTLIQDTDSQLKEVDMAQIQIDTLSLSARELLPALISLKAFDAQSQQVIDYLKEWDGDMAANEQAATLYTVWTDALRKEIFTDEIVKGFRADSDIQFLSSLSYQVSTRKLLEVLTLPEQSKWCDNISTTNVEGCDDVLGKTLRSAIRRLSKLKGSDLSEWTWGEINKTTYAHQPFSQVRLLDIIFQRDIENGGAPDTINVASSSFRRSKGYIQKLGATFRQIISLSESETQHLFMLSTGQSGNPLSINYDDMVEPFRNGELRALNFNSDESSKIILSPLPNQAGKQ